MIWPPEQRANRSGFGFLVAGYPLPRVGCTVLRLAPLETHFCALFKLLKRERLLKLRVRLGAPNFHTPARWAEKGRNWETRSKLDALTLDTRTRAAASKCVEEVESLRGAQRRTQQARWIPWRSIRGQVGGVPRAWARARRG